MPELPHVEGLKEYLDATSLHQTVRHVYLSAEHTLSDVSARTLRRHLNGRALVGSRRHGKELFVSVEDEDWLRLHFGMTGDLKYFENGDAEGPDPEHTRLRLDFEGGGHLAFINPRRLGSIGWVESPEAYVDEEGLGPDALDDAFDAECLRAALKDKRGTLKGALMDQGLVAGIGNVYADEILFQSRLHPRAEPRSLAADAVRAVHAQMRRVLEAAIDAGSEDVPDWFLLPHRHPEGTCANCGAPLEKMRVSGRATWYCPDDQRKEEDEGS
ncbi:MAG: DNA-formamidopyrimidine glycosylase family protein [Longimicrobiales bacterium]|nr:DNA-formamidopyrimidine glycosylase family protein [Longimicrobiales bacterium]